MENNTLIGIAIAVFLFTGILLIGACVIAIICALLSIVSHFAERLYLRHKRLRDRNAYRKEIGLPPIRHKDYYKNGFPKIRNN